MTALSPDRANDRLALGDEGLFDSLPCGVLVLDADGTLVAANPAARRMLGPGAQQLIGRHWPPPDWGVVDESGARLPPGACPALRALRTGRPVRDVVLGIERQHATTWVRLQALPLSAGDPLAASAVHLLLEDITASRLTGGDRPQAIDSVWQAEQRLRDSEERFRQLFDDSRLALMLFEDGRCALANRAAAELLRAADPAQLIGLDPGRLSPAQAADGEGVGHRMFEQNSDNFEWELRRFDGSTFPARVLMTAITVGGQRLHHIVVTDLTEKKQAQRAIEFLAYHDPLTRLPNRLLGQQRLEQAIALAAPQLDRVGLLCLDIDNFKHYNDTYGHPCGDSLLQLLAQRLGARLGAGDTLSRLSGDEFMIVLPRIESQHQLSGLCQRLLDVMAQPFDMPGGSIVATISIGGAVYPDHGGDAGTLMRHADMALYAAKRAWPGCHRFFEPEMNLRLQHYMQTCSALRQAIERGEFELHYQPQLELESGAVVGVEALLRWRSPGDRLVMPADFIEVAEESGLIVPIGRWVLAQACAQAAAWREAGLRELTMSVNLSAVQFQLGSPLDDVAEALQLSGLSPQALELELTESTLLQFDGELAATIDRWKAQGVRLAIDDFGTGYSSLAYLKRLQIDKLKIDRTFISNLNQGHADLTIVRAMLEIARSLELSTVAEGVETSELAWRLQTLGCDLVQGYYCAPAMPAAEFERWLLARERPLF